ncbi:MAG TPA: HAD family phosphatase [Pseudonocardiaceae bacterium]
MTGDRQPLTALIVDYGGVLTSSLTAAMAAWMRAERIPAELFGRLMREWMTEGAAPSPAHDLETGRLPATEFERMLAERLRAADGTGPAAEGLLARMFAGFSADSGMLGVLRNARQHGLRTALLSNSWGGNYDRNGWDELFDAVVISGEVGLRKPEPEIFRLTARQLAVPPQQCVFVDDLAINVRGAAEVGMIGVHHTTLESTVDELETLFGVPLAPDFDPV